MCFTDRKIERMKLIKPNTISAAETLSISDQIYRNLKDSILNGQINQNDFLTEVSVANQFCVSRTPVHDALVKLEADRLIVAIPRKGYKIFNLEAQELVDLYNVAIALSSLSAYYAAINSTSEQLESLRSILLHFDPLAASADSSKERKRIHIKNNYDFHVEIGIMSGNQYLAQSVTEIQEKLTLHRIYQTNYEEVLSATEANTPLHSHERIFEAIELRDPELAEFLMRKHLTCSRDNIKLIDAHRKGNK